MTRKKTPGAPEAPDHSATADILSRDIPPEAKLVLLGLLVAGRPCMLQEVRDAVVLTDGEAIQAFDFCRAAGLVSYDGTRYSLKVA